MLVQQSYRYELKPNNKQKTALAKHAGAARFAYNWGLARRIEEYKQTGKSSNGISQHRQLNALKKTYFPWMYEVSKCAPQEALRDLDKAYNNFWRGIKSGQKTGFPKFKKKLVNDSFRLTGSVHVFETNVVLPRLGKIRTKEYTDIKGHILSVTVRRSADRWYVSITVEREREEYKSGKDSPIGVDVGINSFAVFSDGTKIEHPKPVEKKTKVIETKIETAFEKEVRFIKQEKISLAISSASSQDKQ